MVGGGSWLVEGRQAGINISKQIRDTQRERVTDGGGAWTHFVRSVVAGIRPEMVAMVAFGPLPLGLGQLTQEQQNNHQLDHPPCCPLTRIERIFDFPLRY